MTTRRRQEREPEARSRVVSRLVLRAQEYAASDPETSLMQARKAAEAMCMQVHAREVGDPGNVRLDMLIQRLVERRVLPPRIVMPLRTIQMYGNYAAHARFEPDDMDQPFVVPCLMALTHVVDWYFGEFLQTESPTELSHREQQLGGIQRPEGVANELQASQDCGVTVVLDAFVGYQRSIRIPIDALETFGDLLDVVWVSLDGEVPPYSYGVNWSLWNRETRRTLVHARSIVGASAGEPVSDLRPLGELGVHAGCVLEAHGHDALAPR